MAKKIHASFSSMDPLVEGARIAQWYSTGLWAG
jgi:hypothetical protein